MTRLDDLLKVDGVVAAGEFEPDGTLVTFKANIVMPPEMAEMSAQFCATVSMMFGTLAGAFSQLTAMKWTPPQGWAYSGGEMTVAVSGRYGLFVKTARADFNVLFTALVAERTPSR